ncbi:MAG: hypothetical protein OEV93_02875 [Candidatus Moranbacteria bacterium]|nr:hypothetical protein [Candidatus Moranbacteria bacterium]
MKKLICIQTKVGMLIVATLMFLNAILFLENWAFFVISLLSLAAVMLLFGNTNNAKSPLLLFSIIIFFLCPTETFEIVHKETSVLSGILAISFMAFFLIMGAITILMASIIFIYFKGRNP